MNRLNELLLRFTCNDDGLTDDEMHELAGLQAAEIKRLQFMLAGLRADGKMKSEALTKINNVVQPLWNELKELREGCQTWEEYWAKTAEAEET